MMVVAPDDLWVNRGDTLSHLPLAIGPPSA